jgi:GNAT superfamily N-acetyltransferase
MTDSDAVHFRLAVSEDREVLLSLVKAYRAEDRQPMGAAVEHALELALAGDPMARIYLIEEHARAIGYLAVTLGFSIEAGGRDAFVDELYVERAAQGRGMGTRALQFALDVCRALGAKRACLEVEHHNPRAQALYARLGFSAHTRSLMSKRL